MLLFFFGFGQARRGLLLWINCVISGWNHLHSGGAALFTVDATAASVMAISVLASAAAGQIIYTVVRRRLFWTCGIFGLLFLCPSLIGGMLSPWACALYFGGFIGVWLTAVGRRPTRQTHRVWVMCMAALCICAVLSSGHELKGITEFRNDAAETLRVLRYGEDTMPQGDLDRAYMLDGGSGTQLRVWTGQEKTLYLRGFVGVDYSGGVWTPLADSAYSEEYSGMLAWLGDRGFDPLEQTSMYYSLCEDEQLPETNRVMIENEGASRYYIYAPGSAGDLSVARYTEKKDQRFSPIGIFGADTYTVDETSSSHPAELTVRADWVEHPQTEEQERYAEAEAVYRGFVYDKYTGISQNMRELMQDIFWDDYTAENDGIYSAVDLIRSVLKTRVSYTVSQDETPEDSEPIVYFLNRSHRGGFFMLSTVQPRMVYVNYLRKNIAMDKIPWVNNIYLTYHAEIFNRNGLEMVLADIIYTCVFRDYRYPEIALYELLYRVEIVHFKYDIEGFDGFSARKKRRFKQGPCP